MLVYFPQAPCCDGGSYLERPFDRPRELKDMPTCLNLLPRIFACYPEMAHTLEFVRNFPLPLGGCREVSRSCIVICLRGKVFVFVF